MAVVPFDKPFVIHISDRSSWPPLKALDSLESFAGLCSVPMNFRLVNRSDKATQWEDEAPSLELTAEEFNAWVIGAESQPEFLDKISKDDFALYAAYQYMHETFSQCPELLRLIDWSVFDLDDRGPAQTTLWLGSAGAYTPGHFDSYGCNFVAQLFGSKRWVLFPPDQTDYLYATRQPYEESSVFSRCSFERFKVFKKLQHTTPFVVNMSPGDLLYIPPRWWHFVSCLDTALAVNTWVELPHLDNVGRVEEALVRWIVSSQLEAKSENEDETSTIRVNYTEKVPPTMAESEELLRTAVTNVKSSKTDSPMCYASKVAAVAEKNGWKFPAVEPIDFQTFTERYIADDSDDESESDDESLSDRERILEALLAPDVVSLATKKLLDSRNES